MCVCRLREESAHEAERAKDVATSLGAEHVTLDLEWGDVKNRTETHARYRRYIALLQECSRLGVDTLMTGHHINDQIGV